MDQHTSRPPVQRLAVVETEGDKLISLPAWQRARRRLEHYLALLDIPEPVRQHWASTAFTRALRHQGQDQDPVRLVMKELHDLLDEQGSRVVDLEVRTRTGTDGDAHPYSFALDRTPLRPASLERGLLRRCRTWFFRLIVRLLRLDKAFRA